MVSYWFAWDPNPYAFYIEWLGRPVAWYGILFVLGFIIGYRIIAGMFARYIREQGEFTIHHVAEWDPLLARIKVALDNPQDLLHPVFCALPREVRKAIARDRPLDKTSKEAIASAMKGASRPLLESEFSSAIQSASSIGAGMADRLTWYTVIGTVVGARLGHVIFYEIGDYWNRPWDILKTWEGGLASHGGAIGVMLALALAVRSLRAYTPSMTVLRLFDLVAVPAALVACFIRLGNFVNQELIGIPTDLPWAVLFGHPADGGPLEPRHPVPLYDALANLMIFFVLLTLWRKRGSRQPEGLLIGWFFILCFTARFFIDFVKMPMDSSVETGFLQMGQWLSIPFVLVGIYFSNRSRAGIRARARKTIA